jgi:hypothetical protein
MPSFTTVPVFGRRQPLIVPAETDIRVHVPRGAQHLVNYGGVEVCRQTSPETTTWYKEQILADAQLLATGMSCRLRPGTYAIGAVRNCGGFDIQIESDTDDITQGGVLGSGHTLSDVTPFYFIHSNNNDDVGGAQLMRLISSNLDFRQFYKPLGMVLGLSMTQPLNSNPVEYEAICRLTATLAMVREFRAQGVTVLPWCGFWNETDDESVWYDNNVWTNYVLPNLLMTDAVLGDGTHRLIVDAEPYWPGGTYPSHGHNERRCYAAMAGFLAGLQGRFLYSVPGNFGYAAGEALTLFQPTKTVGCSEHGYLLPYADVPDWTTVDAEVAAATGLGHTVHSGFYDRCLRQPTTQFTADADARNLNRFWIFPRVEDPTAWAWYKASFFTRAWLSSAV